MLSISFLLLFGLCSISKHHSLFLCNFWLGIYNSFLLCIWLLLALLWLRLNKNQFPCSGAGLLPFWVSCTSVATLVSSLMVLLRPKRESWVVCCWVGRIWALQEAHQGAKEVQMLAQSSGRLEGTQQAQKTKRFLDLHMREPAVWRTCPVHLDFCPVGHSLGLLMIMQYSASSWSDFDIVFWAPHAPPY